MSRKYHSFVNDLVFEDTDIGIGLSTTTTEVFNLGNTEIQAIDWDLDSAGAINMRIEILQSNSQSGPFVKWSNPTAAGTTTQNDISTTVETDGSDLQLAPSGYVKLKITNNGLSILTINRMTMYLQ